MLQEEEDSLEPAIEGLVDDNEGTPDLERLETGEEEGDARGLTRSALGPAVGEKTHNVFKTKKVCLQFIS